MISFPFYLQRNYTFAAHKHSTCPTNWANGNSYISNGLSFLFTFKEIIPLQRTNILLVQPTGQMEILISVKDCSCLYHTLIFVEQVYAIHKISVKLQDLLIMKLNKKWKTPVNCYSYKGKDT